MTTCVYLDSVRVTQLPESVQGCEECLKTGDPWLHLRICLECGKVGCCDSSPDRPASAHGRSSGHPLARSIEPGEDWSWCFVDKFALRIPEVRGEVRIPPFPLGGCPKGPSGPEPDESQRLQRPIGAYLLREP